MLPKVFVDARPLRCDLMLYAGDSFSLAVIVTNPDGSPADLTGMTARADIRLNPDSPVIASFAATISGNTISLVLPDTATEALPLVGAVWDCQIASADTVSTLVSGAIGVTAQVTV